MKDKELYYIFRHERIHYKHRDMFYKWLIQIVVCTHWFNRFVYLLEKEENKSCELSCDEKVVSILDDKAKREYGVFVAAFIGSYHGVSVSMSANQEEQNQYENQSKSNSNAEKRLQGLPGLEELDPVVVCK